MNSMSRNLSFDSFESANHSYADTDQLIPQTQINKLPKILFADWLSQEFYGHNGLAFNGGASNGSNYQDTPMNELLSNEASIDNNEETQTPPVVVKEWEKTEGVVALGSPETTNKHLWWGCFCCSSKTSEEKGSVRGNGRMKICIYL